MDRSQRSEHVSIRRTVLASVVALALGTSGCLTVGAVAPNPAPPGALITILGQGFGVRGLLDGVLYGGVSIPVLAWTDSQIVAVLPNPKPNGTYPVQVKHGGQLSAPVSHTIAAATGATISGLHLTPNPNNVLSTVVEFETSASATPWVTVSSSAGAFQVPASGILSAAPGTSHRIAVLGLHTQVPYTITAGATDGAGRPSQPGSLFYTPDPLPAGFPPLALTVRQQGQFAPGLLLFGMTRGIIAADTGIYVVDDGGEPVWYYRKPVTVFSHTAQLRNGDYLYLDYLNGVVGQVDLLGNPVHTWTSNIGGLLHHDVEELPNGNLLMLDAEVRAIPGFPGNQTLNLVGDVVVERDRNDGHTVWSLSLFDVLDPYRYASTAMFDAPVYDAYFGGLSTRDWTHVNNVIYDASDDSLILTPRTQDVILKVSRATKQLVWVAGDDLPSSSADDAWPWLTFVGAGRLPNFPHGPSIAPNGDLILYDNGNELPVEYSRGAQYAIDGASRTIRQVWEYVDPTYHPPLFGPWLGNALAFPGGTALVNDAGINDPNLIYLRMAKLTEVRKSDNQKVWELVVRDPANLEGYNGFDAEKIQSLYPP
ncbi:MAG: aryl-sulfate sulfotransferase [Deltaproteobacteria bacterium]|nr:aryl-sulfate sulfotransferase [Deltaproteobacteria bacterium]